MNIRVFQELRPHLFHFCEHSAGWAQRGFQWMWMEGGEGTMQNVGFPSAAGLRNDHWALLGRTMDLKPHSPTVLTIVGLLIFRSTVQIMNWKLLPAASAHWFWLCLLKPVWLSNSLFQVVKHVRPGPFWLALYRHTHALGFILGCFVRLSINMVQNQTG